MINCTNKYNHISIHYWEKCSKRIKSHKAHFSHSGTHPHQGHQCPPHHCLGICHSHHHHPSLHYRQNLIESVIEALTVCWVKEQCEDTGISGSTWEQSGSNSTSMTGWLRSLSGMIIGSVSNPRLYKFACMANVSAETWKNSIKVKIHTSKWKKMIKPRIIKLQSDFSSNSQLYNAPLAFSCWRTDN